MLRKIVATGDILDLDGTPLLVETIDFAGLSGSLLTVSNGFNDSGEVAFLVSGETQDEFGGTGEFIDAIVVSDIAMMSAELPGDYNQNGVVDAADYTVWRDNLGSGTALPNDDTPGVGQDDYARWKASFGESLGSGSSATAGSPSSAGATGSASANSPVPEPATWLLLAIAALASVISSRPCLQAIRGTTVTVPNWRK